MLVSDNMLYIVIMMATLTYLTRFLGFWLTNNLTLSDRSQAFLNRLPTNLLVAMLVPMLMTLPLNQYPAVIICVALMLATGNLFISIGLSTICACLI